VAESLVGSLIVYCPARFKVTPAGVGIKKRAYRGMPRATLDGLEHDSLPPVRNRGPHYFLTVVEEQWRLVLRPDDSLDALEEVSRGLEHSESGRIEDVLEVSLESERRPQVRRSKMLLVGGQVEATRPGGSQVANRLEERVILLAVAPQPVIGESQRGALERFSSQRRRFSGRAWNP
jgi:hypothetical protein